MQSAHLSVRKILLDGMLHTHFTVRPLCPKQELSKIYLYKQFLLRESRAPTASGAAVSPPKGGFLRRAVPGPKAEPAHGWPAVGT